MQPWAIPAYTLFLCLYHGNVVTGTVPCKGRPSEAAEVRRPQCVAAHRGAFLSSRQVRTTQADIHLYVSRLKVYKH